MRLLGGFMKNLALTLCLLLPVAVFAQDPVVPAPATAADAPANPSLVPNEGQPKPELVPNENARWCGAHGCGGGHKGGAAFIVTTSVIGTVLTAVAVGVAVSVATAHHDPGQVR